MLACEAPRPRAASRDGAERDPPCRLPGEPEAMPRPITLKASTPGDASRVRLKMQICGDSLRPSARGGGLSKSFGSIPVRLRRLQEARVGSLPTARST